ncbi:regulatory protein GemA [Roseospirillum parvum]|uniref:Uncharacterized protein n=1 Tax=Roseospirillum parvum TaxID=83401 RepID=A0A1G8GH16_9PROT|nr:regulatory protein GemA [Roseospirillum parvum]SDH93678.1 Protein of unknown function [Roseospirillum parvum]
MANLDDVKRRLAALLSMTTAAGCTEAEAEAAAAKAAQLMRQHGLEAADLVMGCEAVPCTRRPTVVHELWSVLAALTGCTTVRDAADGTLSYVGRQPGPAVATYLHVFLHRHIEASTAAYRRSAQYKRRARGAPRRRACEAFRTGMVERLQLALVVHFGAPDMARIEEARDHVQRLYEGRPPRGGRDRVATGAGWGRQEAAVMTAARKYTPTPFRKQLYAKVQIARKQLSLGEDTYRALLEGRYGVESLTQLSGGQLVDLVEHLRSLGFKPAKRPPARAGTRRPLADGDEARKVRALWLSLYHLGVVRDPSETALERFLERQSGGRGKGVPKLQWMRSAQALKVIEALKAMGARPVEQGGGGVDWAPYRVRGEMPGEVRVVEFPRRRVVEAQCKILGITLREAEQAGRDGGPRQAGFAFYANADWDRLIEHLGDRVRAARGGDD